jgi:hypothetical protein
MSAVGTEELRRPLVRSVANFAFGSELGVKVQPALDRSAKLSRDAATGVAAMLSPAAAIALVLSFWRLGSDLGWTGQFAISNGLFSHWQVWFALAIILGALAPSSRSISR